MIVYDPPAPPPGMRLDTVNPHHRAVEAAIRIARLDFICEQQAGPVEWMRLLAVHGAGTTFIILQDDRPTITLEVVDEVDAGSVDAAQHRIVRGAEGVLHLAADLSRLAAI